MDEIVSLGLDISVLNRYDQKLVELTRHAEQFRDTIKSVNFDSGGTVFNLLNRMSEALGKVSGQKLSINIDTSSVDRLFSTLKDAFVTIRELSSQGSKIDILGSNDISKAISGFDSLEKEIIDIDKALKTANDDLNKLVNTEPKKFEPEAFVPKINPRNNKPFGANTDTQKAAYAEYQERMRLAEDSFNREQQFLRDSSIAQQKETIAKLEAVRNAKQEELNLEGKSQAEILNFVQKRVADEVETERAAAKKIQDEFNATYEKMKTARTAIQAMDEAKGSKGFTSKEQKDYDTLVKLEEGFRNQLKQIYEKHQAELTTVATREEQIRATDASNKYEAALKASIDSMSAKFKSEQQIINDAIASAQNASSGTSLLSAKGSMEKAMAIVKPEDIDTVNRLNQAYGELMLKLQGIATASSGEQAANVSKLDMLKQLYNELVKLSTLSKESDKVAPSLDKIVDLTGRISSVKISPTVETTPLERLTNVLAGAYNHAENLTRLKPNTEFFDSKAIHDTGEGLLQAKKGLDDTRMSISQVEAAYNGLDKAVREAVDSQMKFVEKKVEIPEFKPLINERNGKPFGANTDTQKAHKAEYDARVKALQAAVDEENRINLEAFNKQKNERISQISAMLRAELEAERASLQEALRTYQERVRFFKMTTDERIEYVRKMAEKEEQLHAKSIKKIQSEYKKMLGQEFDILKSADKLKKSGVNTTETKAQLDEYYRQLEEINAKRRQHEEQFGEYLVEIGEKAERRLLNIRLDNIKREREERLTTPQGALDFAANAKTRGQKEQAKKYVEKALDNVDEKDVQMVEKLRTAYIKLRGEIETFNKGLKNEQTLQPTIHNEYERQLKALDDIVAAKKRAAETQAYKSGDAKAIENYEAILAREKDVRDRIALLENALQDKLNETKRKHAADNAMREVAETEKVEAQKAEIAKKKFREVWEERKKTASISTTKAEKIIADTGNAKNVLEEKAAVEKLKEARDRLDMTKSNSQKVLARLNAEIDAHEKSIKRATDATYRKKEAEEKANKKNTTFQGALDYSKQTKSIQDQVKAIQYLKEARDKLSRTNNPDYEVQVRALTREITRQQAEVDRLKGKQDSLNDSQKKLSGTAQQLARRLSYLFSVQSITGYIEKVITVRGEFEKQQKALGAILQDVDKTNELWKQTVELAVKSPFRVKELVTYTKQLAAYRIETDRLHASTKMLADISAGLGVDMNRLILAYGQVKAANYLRGTELRQFSEAGINVLKELADYFTEIEGRAVSVGDVFDRVSKRLVSFQDVDAVLQKVTSEGGIFYKMQEQQSQTIEGMRMNLKDSIDLMLDEIGKANEGTIKWGINATKGMIENWRELAFQLKLILPLLGLYKLATWANSAATKTAAKDTLWLNGALKKQGVVLVEDARVMTFANAKMLGFTKTQVLFARATAIAQTAVKGLMSALSVAAPMLLISAIVMLISKLTETQRAAKALKKELDGIFEEDYGHFKKNLSGLDELIKAYERANRLGLDKSKIITQLNTQYGDYLSFIVEEKTTVDELSNSYENVVARMKEKHAMKTYEKSMDAIDETYNKQLVGAKQNFYDMFKVYSSQSMNTSNILARVNNTGNPADDYIIHKTEDIDNIYSILQQRVQDMNADSIDSLEEQKALLKEIVAEYYGLDIDKVTVGSMTQIKLLDVILRKKREEDKLQAEINALYEEKLHSREGILALEENKKYYAERRRAIEEREINEHYTQFDKKKDLENIIEEEKLSVIDIKFRFGAMSESGAEKAKSDIVNWASAISEDINDAILSGVGNIDTTELDNLNEEIKQVGKEMAEQFQGNVDLLNRKMIPATKLAAKGWKDVGEGYATVFSSQYGIQDNQGNNVEILVTPILPNGEVMSQEELESYIDNTLNGAEDILAADDKGIVIKVGVSTDGSEGELLHRMQEVYYNAMNSRRAMFSEYSAEELDSVMLTKDVQSQKSTAEYLKTLQNNLQRERELLLEAVSLQSEGIHDYSDEIAQHERKIELHEKVLNLLGVETEGTKKLSEETRNAINSVLPDDMKITFEDAYKGIDTIISEIQKKETQIANIIKQQNHLKEEGQPYDEEALENAKEEYKWLKKKQDLIDNNMKKPISEEKVTQVNSKLKDEYKIDTIDAAKDEATLLSEANQKKEEAIATQERLNAQVAQGIILKEGELEKVKEEIEQWTLRWKLLGGTEKSKSNSDNLTEERIRVIDQMNKKFRELNKTLSTGESVAGAFEAYKDAFAKAYKGTSILKGVNMKKITPEEFIEKVFNFPDRDDVVRVLDDLVKIVPDLEDKIKVELAKGKHVEEMNVEVRVKLQADVKEQVDALFDNYEVNVELKRLNVPKEYQEKLFGIRDIQLPQLKDETIQKFATLTEQSAKLAALSKDINENFNNVGEKIKERPVNLDKMKEKGWTVDETSPYKELEGLKEHSVGRVHLTATPILPNGDVLTEAELEAYLNDVVAKAQGDITMVAQFDTSGLVLDASNSNLNFDNAIASLKQYVDTEKLAATEQTELVNELSKGLEDINWEYVSDAIGKEAAENVRKNLEEIAKMELEQRRDLLKQALEFARTESTERAKIRIEEIQKLAAIEAAYAYQEGDTEETKKYKDSMKAKAKKKVKDDSDKAVARLDLQSLTQAETFEVALQGIAGSSKTLVQNTISNLEQVRDKLQELGDIEGANEAADKIRELQVQLFQFEKVSQHVRAAKNDLKDFFDASRDSESFDIYSKIKDKDGNLVNQGKERFEFKNEDAKKMVYGDDGKKEVDLAALKAALELELQSNEAEIRAEQEKLALIEEAESIQNGTKQLSDEELANRTELTQYLGMSNAKLEAEKENVKSTAKDESKRTGIIEDQLNTFNKILKANDGQVQKIQKAQRILQTVRKAWDAIIECIGEGEDSALWSVIGGLALDTADSVLNIMMMNAEILNCELSAQAFGAAMKTAMGPIGWILLAIELIIKALTALFKWNAKKNAQEVQMLADKANLLADAFEKVADAIGDISTAGALESVAEEIEATYKAASDAYEKALDRADDRRKVKRAEKLEKKLEKAEEKGKDGRARRLENRLNRKKDSDAYEAYQELLDAQLELDEEYLEARNELYSKATGGIFDDELSASQGFVDAWLEAFKETGDGLSGLEEHFDEFIQDFIKQQMSLMIADKYIEDWNKRMRDYYDNDDKLSEDEIVELVGLMKGDVGQMSNEMKALYEAYGNLGFEGSANLSGLQAGISGITEEQADILAAYWNAVRQSVSSIEVKIGSLDSLKEVFSNLDTNPILENLQNIATNTLNIANDLATIKNFLVDDASTIEAGGYTAIRMKMM